VGVNEKFEMLFKTVQHLCS